MCSIFLCDKTNKNIIENNIYEESESDIPDLIDLNNYEIENVFIYIDDLTYSSLFIVST